MKKIIILLFGVLLTSCSKDLDTTNIDKEPEVILETVDRTSIEEVVVEKDTIKKTEEVKPTVRIKDTLYYSTGISINVPRCGTFGGEIETTVAQNEIPTENFQSNFGSGYGYQTIGETTIDILMDNKWIRFDSQVYDDYVVEARTLVFEYFDYFNNKELEKMKSLMVANFDEKNFTEKFHNIEEALLIWPKLREDLSSDNRLVFQGEFMLTPSEDSDYEEGTIFKDIYITLDKFEDSFLISDFDSEVETDF